MLVDPFQSRHNSHGVGAHLPSCHQLSMLWNLSFMYKGEVYARYCTGKFILFQPKGKGKARLHAARNV